MSPLIRGTILVALPLGIILLPTVYGKCVLKCETDSRCAGTVSGLKGKECRKIDQISHDSNSSHTHLNVSWSKRQTNVTISNLTQADYVVLSLPGRNGRVLCLNVTVPELTPGISSRVLLECKHVSASTKGKTATLYDPNAHQRLAQSLVKRPNHRKSTRCTCKIPYKVRVDIPNGRSIRVTWDWDTVSPTDMTEVEIVNSTGGPVVASVVLNTVDKIQQYVFEDFDELPGKYIAKVGSAGCPGCKRSRHSEEFQWPVPSTNPPASRRRRQHCECWTPQEVSLEAVNRTNIILRWQNFYDKRDIIVGIVSVGDTENFVVKELIHNYRLKRDKIQEFNFTFSQPAGTYIGLVGSYGCGSCMRYRESEPFPWDIQEPTPEPMPNTTMTTSHDDESMSSLQIGILIAVGTMTCISVLALGIILYRRGILSTVVCRYERVSSEQVSETNSLVSAGGERLSEVHNVMVLRQNNDDDLKHSADRLFSKIHQRGKTVKSQTLLSVTEEELIFYVKDGIDDCLPDMLKTVANKTAVVAVHNTDVHVHVPRDFVFNDLPFLPNNKRHYDLDSLLDELGSLFSGGGRLSDVHNVMVLCQNIDNENLNHSADRLAMEIRQRGKTITSQTLLSVTEEELIFYVKDGIDDCLPDMLKTVANKTAVVAVHNTDVHVHVPRDFVFNDLPLLPNNKRHYDLDIFLNKLVPNVYILASEDDDAHARASQQFVAVVKKLFPLESSVVFASDRSHWKEQRANVDEWVTKTINDATYIVVVASPQVGKTSDIRSSQESLTNTTRISCRAMDKVLESDQHRAKVILVSFGYWEHSLHHLKDTLFPACQTFQLVKKVQGAEPELELAPFLECLCSNTELVERIRHEDHREFLDQVMDKVAG